MYPPFNIIPTFIHFSSVFSNCITSWPCKSREIPTTATLWWQLARVVLATWRQDLAYNDERELQPVYAWLYPCIDLKAHILGCFSEFSFISCEPYCLAAEGGFSANLFRLSEPGSALQRHFGPFCFSGWMPSKHLISHTTFLSSAIHYVVSFSALLLPTDKRDVNKKKDEHQI